jgi:hypothetical protein
MWFPMGEGRFRRQTWRVSREWGCRVTRTRLAVVGAPILATVAVVFSGLAGFPVSAQTVTGYRFPAPPVAPAGSLGPGQSVSFPVRVVSGTAPDPGGAVYLFYAHDHANADSTTVPAAQCSGVARISMDPNNPTLCTADSKGQVLLTYTAGAQPNAQGGVRFVAESAPTSPHILANTHYVYCAVYRFTSSPIARGGSLSPSASVPVTLGVTDGSGNASPASTVYLSFQSASGGGSATVGPTTLTSTPKLFVADSNGLVQITYTAPLTLPGGGQDSIVVQDLLTKPTEVNTDMYAFSASTPVVSVGDVTVIEGDQLPGIPADFTVTVSPKQSTPVTVDYTTMCGIGDEGCEIKIPDNFNPVLTPKTVTIPANTNSIKINVQQFSYTGGHGGETYNEGWFIKLQNPSGAILGRSVGTGLLLPDVEGTPAVLPYLYTGSAAVVPTTDAGGEPLYFAVTLGSVETSTVTFDYATSDGSAFAGTDYTAASGTASIPAGKTSAIIPITLLPNSPPGTNRSFTLTISNASGGSGLLISRPTGTGTILAS